MNIVTALETLSLDGLTDDHDEVIETVLSKLFIRGDEVHKAYKHRTADFADLADREVRRQYIAEDFFWNNAMAPEIYHELRGVRKEGERFIHIDDSTHEDWYIVMKKIDRTRDLIKTLERGAPKQEDLITYVRTLQERLRTLTDARRSELEEFFTKDTTHVITEILATKDWAFHTADDLISHEAIERAMSLMTHVIKTEEYFQNPIHTLSVVIDTNGDNILFLEDGVTFIDVMPPKESWRVHDAYFLICRTSTDVSALSHITHAEVLHESFITHGPTPPPAVRMVYEIAAGLIQVPYRKMVGRDDLAQKYADFIRMRTDDLATLIENQK